tara:strand:+ start:103 stop:384 length:282 start_codon:yes stop_codon:yes gene_type:complete
MNSTSDAILLPVNNILGIDATAADALSITFKEIGGAADEASVVLNITSGKAKEVMNAIVDEISFSRNPFVVIADDVNSAYVHPDLTTCGTITP